MSLSPEIISNLKNQIDIQIPELAGVQPQADVANAQWAALMTAWPALNSADPRDEVAWQANIDARTELRPIRNALNDQVIALTNAIQECKDELLAGGIIYPPV